MPKSVKSKGNLVHCARFPFFTDAGKTTVRQWLTGSKIS